MFILIQEWLTKFNARFGFWIPTYSTINKKTENAYPYNISGFTMQWDGELNPSPPKEDMNPGINELSFLQNPCLLRFLTTSHKSSLPVEWQTPCCKLTPRDGIWLFSLFQDDYAITCDWVNLMCSRCNVCRMWMNIKRIRCISCRKKAPKGAFVALTGKLYIAT